ncbi:MAG TPA: histidine triad nucleotide-binding protein [Gemmatimonadaceae bacterium]|jgi:histidine triad (HIT) family protein|nr:histidine triad nucleotide-binding protein [Gemmatimonadaceae bacterium]
MSADDCLFCRIISGEIPASKVGETPDAIAIRDINPQAPYHVLIIPREHIRSLNETTDAGLLGRLLLFAAGLARDAGYADSGYRVVINTNADGGQTVFHLHLHLLAGRHLHWPPG